MSENEKQTNYFEFENRRMQMIMSWMISIVLFSAGAFLLFALIHLDEKEALYWDRLLCAQFPVIVGVPLAGLGALFVTLILKIAVGPLEFEIAGLKFQGGAAPIVFWILCFLSIVLAISMLWQTGIDPVCVLQEDQAVLSSSSLTHPR
ncbi:MAG: hypothetical protein AAF542_01660 [Pseudomonadota bacterium]